MCSTPDRAARRAVSTRFAIAFRCFRPCRFGKRKPSGAPGEVQVETSGAKRGEKLRIASHREAVAPLLDTLWSGETHVISKPSEIDVVGHRVVNGGPEFQQPTLVTPEVKAAIARMSAFAPLHNRAELEGMDAIEKQFGSVPQIAVFDTGFHSRLPEAAFVYPGPYDWFSKGIRRYGFHGINHQYCAERAAAMLDKD